MNTDCLCKENAFAKGANILLREVLTECDMVKLVVQAGSSVVQKSRTLRPPGVKEKGSTKESIRASYGI